MYSKVKLLLLVTEFRTWYFARQLSYSAQLGMEEGLRANDVDYHVATTACLPDILNVLPERSFDQIWVVGRLDLIDELSLQRLVPLAPVRVGMLSESLEYTPEEYALSPRLKGRKERIDRRLPYFTHVAACDETDAIDIHARYGIPAVWWPQSVPKRFISATTGASQMNSAIFCGNAYALRREYLNHPELQRILVHVMSAEWTTLDPLLFTVVHLPTIWPLRHSLPMSGKVFAAYLSGIRSIRQRCFAGWLRTLQRGQAVVNLPHFVKAYAGRVVEGMAAGRPVISWKIPGRSQNGALFDEEREILLFAKGDPHQLAEQIRRVSTDRALSRQIVANASRKLRRFHTSETRTRQILEWVTDGRIPRYFD